MPANNYTHLLRLARDDFQTYVEVGLKEVFDMILYFYRPNETPYWYAYPYDTLPAEIKELTQLAIRHPRLYIRVAVKVSDERFDSGYESM